MIAEHYTGVRVNGKAVVAVKRRGIVSELDPALSRSVRKHSTAFEWGYGGSGPAQLALALLLDHGLTAEQAELLYHDFKFDLIADMPEQNWKLTGAEVEAWILRKQSTKEVS